MFLTCAVRFLRSLTALIAWDVGQIGFICCEPGGHTSNASSNDDGDDGEFSTAGDDELVTEEQDPETEEDPDTEADESTGASSLTENAALAGVFKKTRKNVKKGLGDRLPQRGDQTLALPLGRPSDLPS